MKRVKRKIYSGTVLEQIVYTVPDRQKDLKRMPVPRFKTEAERAAHRDGIARRRFIRLINENFTPASLYSTLTFSTREEVHDFEDARILRNNFVRRLRHKYPDSRIAIVMGRGEHTHRIHFHMVSDGIPQDYIEKQWIYGDIVRIEHLRAHNTYDGRDHGADYTGLANYLYDHWTPEQGGHRYKVTKNMSQPHRDEAREIKREYTVDKPPITPKGYTYIGAAPTAYGFISFKYVKTPPPRRKQ